MPSRPRCRLLAALSLVLALGVAGCGNKHAVITEAETEGPYLNVGQLKYQVQASRQLNPASIDDRAYLEGVDPAERDLRPDETWFAIFVRAINEHEATHPAAEHLEIEDTQGKVFEPIALAPTNPFAYQPTRVPARGSLPAEGSVADEAPIGGSMVLFKLTLESLGNRPLELTIQSPTAPSKHATVELDV